MSAQAFRSSFALERMKSSMSGWSMFRITIFAARRVLPPDLIAPAKESKPFMKESGPEAVPAPYLKSMPSVLARSRIEPMESPQELMKQAEAWGLGSMPTLNQTGELK